MSTDTSTRPFQVGDRVRITDNNIRHLHPGAQYVFEGVVSKIDPPADPDSEHMYGPYLWADTEPYTSPAAGHVFDRVFCPLTDDLTTGSDDERFGRTIKLLEPAPGDSPTPDFYEVRAAHNAAADLAAKWRAEDAETPTQDHGPLAAPLSDRTLAKVLSRPAHMPSLVLLDRDAAAQRLADAVADYLAMPTEEATDLRKALADYRATVQS